MAYGLYRFEYLPPWISTLARGTYFSHSLFEIFSRSVVDDSDIILFQISSYVTLIGPGLSSTSSSVYSVIFHQSTSSISSSLCRALSWPGS